MWEILHQSVANLMAHKLRSLLTMFGLTWGILSIIILSAVGEGFQQGNLKTLRELGQNILIIRNGRTTRQAGGGRAGRIIRLELPDVELLQARSRLIEHLSPELMRIGIRVKSDWNASTSQMSGIWPIYQTLRTIEVDRGRPLNKRDGEERHRVALLGFELSRQLFAERDPVGLPLALNGIAYTVVGRIRKKEQDSNYTGADDYRLFLPYETMRRDFPLPSPTQSTDSLSAIIAAPFPQVARELEEHVRREGKINPDLPGPLEREVLSILSTRHHFDPSDPEALSMWNTVQEAVFFSQIIGSMRDFFLVVSLITLGLGGIGVTNIMLISVRERTREIGLRKALGATPQRILWLFLCEGMGVTLLGGAIGLVLGLGICTGINQLPLPPRFAGMVVTWQSTMLAIGLLSLVGIAAALHPARRAARLAPIEALRFEAN